MLIDYIREKRSKGAYSFTSQEAIAELGISSDALKSAVYRLKKKGMVISPARGLYVPIPAEYQQLGCLPAEELVPILMKHYQLDYYVCLLSAAYYFGASHQKTQTFQVMLAKQLKPIRFGKVSVQFVYKKNLSKESERQQRVVKTGFLNIASPELILKDLFFYPARSGGLNHIATVISELIEAVEIKKLSKLIDHEPGTAWMQRLGYLLENIETFAEKKRIEIIDLLQSKFHNRSLTNLPLATELSAESCTVNLRWKIIENVEIESDL